MKGEIVKSTLEFEKLDKLSQGELGAHTCVVAQHALLVVEVRGPHVALQTMEENRDRG